MIENGCAIETVEPVPVIRRGIVAGDNLHGDSLFIHKAAFAADLLSFGGREILQELFKVLVIPVLPMILKTGALKISGFFKLLNLGFRYKQPVQRAGTVFSCQRLGGFSVSAGPQRCCLSSCP